MDMSNENKLGYVCHTSYGNTIENPYDADVHNPPLDKWKMIHALDEAYALNQIELHKMLIEKLNNAARNGDVTYVEMRLKTLIDWKVKLVNAHGRKFTGILHRNGYRNGLAVIDKNGKRRTFEYNEFVKMHWNDMPNGSKRAEITYMREME